MLLRKYPVGNQKVPYFHTLPNYCFCTACGNRKPGIASFDLSDACFLVKTYKTHFKISPGRS